MRSDYILTFIALAFQYSCLIMESWSLLSTTCLLGLLLWSGTCCVIPHHNKSCPGFARPKVVVPDIQVLTPVETRVEREDLSAWVRRLNESHQEMMRNLNKRWPSKNCAGYTKSLMTSTVAGTMLTVLLVI